MALKQDMSTTDKLNLRIKQLEGRVAELENEVQRAQQDRRVAEARQEGYAAAVKALGSREPDVQDVYTFPFHPMMFRRY